MIDILSPRLYSSFKIFDNVRELERNREKINSSRTKVTDFVGMTDTARRMLVGMENRDTQQKMILGGIGIFLLVALILVIYFATKKQ